jgi:hypothetical protein
MEEKQKLNVLGLIGLILGIVAAIISFIPCLGMYAIFPGVLGLILSALGLRKVKKGLAIAGLIFSLIGTGVAAWQMYQIQKMSNELKQMEEELQNLDSIQ